MRTLKEIAGAVEGKVVGDENTVVYRMNSLEEATEGDLAVFFDPSLSELVKITKASALIVPSKIDFYHGPQLIFNDRDIKSSYVRIAALFMPEITRFNGISDKAFIHSDAQLGKDLSIYPRVYIGSNAQIEDEVTLFPGVFIGDNVKIGKNSVLYPNVSIMESCIIGKNVVIHAGTVVGSDGFGYIHDKEIPVKVPQLGIVLIEDNVEIGANVCIDRAALGSTIIRRHAKIDNLVQIAHKVEIGENTLLAAQVGIAGGVKVGKNVMMGGQVGVKDHISIGDRVMIGAQSGIGKSVKSGEGISGSPAIPHRRWLKSSQIFSSLPDMLERLRSLEKQVKDMSSLLNKNGEKK